MSQYFEFSRPFPRAVPSQYNSSTALKMQIYRNKNKIVVDILDLCWTCLWVQDNDD